MHSGIHPSPHQNCHHQIAFANINFTIFYPPLYTRLVCHCQQANDDPNKRAIDLYDWEKNLSNLDVNKHVSIFNETIMDIFENFIPNQTVTCNEKEPTWMNKQINALKGSVNC